MPRPILYHKVPIAVIKTFQAPLTGVLNFPGKSVDGSAATFEKYRKSYDIKWPDNHNRTDNFKLGSFNKTIGFKTATFDLVLERIFIRSRGKNIISTTSAFKTKGFKNSSAFYYRLVIPLIKSYDINNLIQRYSFLSDLGYSSTDGTHATIDGDQLRICAFHEDDKYYLVIESYIKQNREIFSEKTHAIKNALGYITGYLPADAGFYFAYSTKAMMNPVHFCFEEWRNSIRSMYKPIYGNPFGYIRDDKKAQKLYLKGILREMLFSEFSGLCNKLYQSREFTGVIILILEASVSSLLFMPGGYAIALETMADLIIGDIKVERSLIPNKQLRNRILKGLKTVIEMESEHLAIENKETLIARISQLPQGTNKSRLKAPFDILGVSLSDADLQVIDARNAFLHGRVPDLDIAAFKNVNTREGKILYYCSLRLYTLLSRLILKWIGFENYTLNQVKIQEDDLGFTIQEDYYYKDF